MPESSYYRSGFGRKKQIVDELFSDYHSEVVEWMRSHGNKLPAGPLEIRLAREFGFCYGVEKAVDMAYEARREFPDRRIALTHEIIHNPRVNERLREMGIGFLPKNPSGSPDISGVQERDVVILPAFGVPMAELEQLRRRGCVLVDTTCGSVMQVWRRVERFAREGFTALIHGKYGHEETIATKSRAVENGGQYLVVRDLEEAEIVCDAIKGKADPERLRQLISRAASPGFDARVHFDRIGVANQTTMLSSESLEIAEKVRQALIERYGESSIDKRFIAFDTICSSTQNRQDAVLELAGQGLDLMLIVGGFNSSNTGHLCEIAARFCPSFHIDDASAILSPHEIRHKPVDQSQAVISRGWWPESARVIGLTAGASTPNRAIGETIRRLLEVRGISLPPECSGGA